MKVVFLCGGIGKRMFPILEDKFLLNFVGKTLLEHQIEIAREVGLKKFVFVCNEFNVEKIKKISEKLKLDAEICIQKEPKGMADALLTAEKFLDDEIIVVNPNDVFEKDAYTLLLKERGESEYDSFIIGYRVSSYFPGGYLVINERNELQEIQEKPGEGNEPSDLVNIVIHLHRKPKRLLEYLEKTKSVKDDVYEVSITKMVKDGFKIKVVPYDGYWSAIKYPWHVFDVVKYFLDRSDTKISPNTKISEKASIEGKVIIEDGVRILENASIKGPCYIGKNSLIGTNSLVREYSHIGENCIIGYNTEVKHSYIGNNCLFHSSYIGDSIIASNCLFGAGSITANLRFDGKSVKVNVKGKKVDTKLEKFGVIVGENCKIGINVALMPGVKIGPNSVVGPHVVLYEDLEPGKMVCVKQEHVIKENVENMDEKTKLIVKHLE